MNPSPAAIAKIQAYVAAMSGQWNNTNAQILAAYNAATVTNPAAQATIAKPYSLTDLLLCVTTSYGNLRACPSCR